MHLKGVGNYAVPGEQGGARRRPATPRRQPVSPSQRAMRHCRSINYVQVAEWRARGSRRDKRDAKREAAVPGVPGAREK